MPDTYTLIGFRFIGDDLELVDANGRRYGPVPASALVEALREIGQAADLPPVQIEQDRPATAEVAVEAAKAVESYVQEKSPVAYQMLRVVGENWPSLRERFQRFAEKITPETNHDDDAFLERYYRRKAARGKL